MGLRHDVQQGEHLSAIAERYGFHDYLIVWNHPENAALKAKRGNPNVLFPGDVVMIPKKRVADYSRPTDQRHRFTRLTKPLQLKVILGNLYDGPLAGVPCTLFVEAEQFALTTTAQGEIRQEITKTAGRAGLVIKNTLQVQDQAIPLETELEIKIGYLDPVDERSGQVVRLSNLGYYRGPLDTRDEPELLSAIEEFQCDHGLTVDGKCGSLTQAKLKQVHGC